MNVVLSYVICALIAAGVTTRDVQSTFDRGMQQDVWSKFVAQLTDLNWPHKAQFAALVRRLANNAQNEISTQCHASLMQFSDDVHHNEAWAIQSEH